MCSWFPGRNKKSVCLYLLTLIPTATFLERSLPLAIGTCVMLGAVVGGFDYTGQMMGDPISREERRKRFFKTPPKPLVEVERTAE